jgi:hypothetical protein
VLARAVTRSSPSPAFAAAGLVFGLAALTRSMPLFFVGPAAILHVLMSVDRRAGVRKAAALLLGFAVLTIPYSVMLSRSLGQLTLIDSHGSIHLESAGGRAPGVAETVTGLWRAVASAPVAYLEGVGGRAASLLHVNGGRQLQIYVVAGSKPAAVVWKTLVHLGTDGLLIAAVVLAPFGAVVCRNRRVAALLILWTAINVAIASVGGFGGARLRVPFEPLLMVIGAAALVGGWRRPARPVLAAGALGSLLLAAVVLPQLPRSLRAWPDYGVAWESVLVRTVGQVRGTAAFNLPAYSGAGEFGIRSRTDGPPVRVRVRAAGSDARTFAVGGEIVRVPVLWPEGGLAYVEIEATDRATRAPAAVEVHAPPR